MSSKLNNINILGEYFLYIESWTWGGWIWASDKHGYDGSHHVRIVESRGCGSGFRGPGTGRGGVPGGARRGARRGAAPGAG